MKGYSVKFLTRRSLPAWTSEDGQQVVGDLLDPDSYRAALAGCEVVVHLAAATGRAAPRHYERVNVEGTRALLHACKSTGVRRFLHMSTIAAGYPDQRYYPYAQTKLRAETLVRESGIEFAIVRPTLILGRASPIWNTLLKIAKLPVVPLPEGARPVLVQPIHVDDVARGIELLLQSGSFKGEVLELGGPRPLPFREFLGLVQRALRGREGRTVSVPLTPIQALLALVEPAMRPLMPVAAGQLSLFGNDAVPAANWLQSQLQVDMPSTEETISDLVHAGSSGADRGSPPLERPARPIPEDVKRVLQEECRTFATYLVGTQPRPYVEEQYVRAAHSHALAFDEDFCCFDRATVGLARTGGKLVRCSDAYCAIFHRRGTLRRKLIVLAAILEHVAPTSEAFDGVEAKHSALAVLSLAGHGCIAAAALLVGTALLLPARLVCWMRTRSTRSGIRARQVL
jgi:NADH dehydrogenase